MPTLQGDKSLGGKPANGAGEGSPKVSGSGAEVPETTVLDSWSMEATLLEKVAEAKSWNIREMQSKWYVVWYKVGAAKPQVQALGIRAAQVDTKALRHKIHSKVEEEKVLLEACKVVAELVAVTSRDMGTPGQQKIVLSEGCKEDRKKRSPDAKVAGKAKAIQTVETAGEEKADPVTTKKPMLSRPIDFEEVSRILTAEGKTPTREECVAYVHNQLGAEVVAEGSKPSKDRYSVMASGLLIADDKLIGLQVVGIGAVDSSGSRGRYAKVTRVTNARVEVEFEDSKEGQYVNKNKAEPVDVHVLSLMTGEQVFSQAELDKAVKFRQTSRVCNKLDKGHTAKRKKTPGSHAASLAAKKERQGKGVYKMFVKTSRLWAGSEPPPKKRKARDEDERLGVEVLPTEEYRAQALAPGMKAMAQGLMHLTSAGVIPLEAFKSFRDKLNDE